MPLVYTSSTDLSQTPALSNHGSSYSDWLRSDITESPLSWTPTKNRVPQNNLSELKSVGNNEPSLSVPLKTGVPRGYSSLRKKPAANNDQSLSLSTLKIGASRSYSNSMKVTVANTKWLPSPPSKIGAPRSNSNLQKKSSANNEPSPSISTKTGALRGNSSLPEKSAANTKRLPSLSSSKICVPVNHSTVDTERPARTTTDRIVSPSRTSDSPTAAHRDSPADKCDEVARGFTQCIRSSGQIAVTASSSSKNVLERRADSPNGGGVLLSDVSQSTVCDERATSEQQCQVPFPFVATSTTVPKSPCHENVRDCKAGDFDPVQSNVLRRPCHGDGDTTTINSASLNRDSMKSYRVNPEKKLTPTQRRRAFERLWTVSDDPIKIVPTRLSKAKKTKQIFDVYTDFRRPKMPFRPKNSTLDRTIKPSSYINRLAKLKETQRTNNIVVKKLLTIKSTISTSR